MQIELLKPHTHAGKPCAPGDVIVLDDDLARWLVKTGSARVLPVPKSHSPTEESSK